MTFFIYIIGTYRTYSIKCTFFLRKPKKYGTTELLNTLSAHSSQIQPLPNPDDSNYRRRLIER